MKVLVLYIWKLLKWKWKEPDAWFIFDQSQILMYGHLAFVRLRIDYILEYNTTINIEADPSRQVVFRYTNIRCFPIDVWEVNMDFIGNSQIHVS